MADRMVKPNINLILFSQRDFERYQKRMAENE